jgi:GTP pyrophosphokinase
MVKMVKTKPPLTISDPEFLPWCHSLVFDPSNLSPQLFEAVVKLVNGISVDEKAIEEKALYDSLIKESLQLASILSELRVDSETLTAAFLYPFVDALLITLDDISAFCNAEVSKKVQGVIVMDGVRGLQTDRAVGSDAGQIENIRKMLLVMVDDVTVVTIKLAERLFQLRTAKDKTLEEREVIAEEVRDVFAPLANRLGVGHIKWEMEDLAFRYLNPEPYKKIAKYLAEKRIAREVYVNQVLKTINQSLVELDINAELMGRAKHIYSIWKKMIRKNVGFEEIYDVRAIRVLVPEVQDCYSVLGVVHGLWKHIPKEFDDYVATPKENGYRSLHTAVIGPEGKTLEIQIRTHEMHQESELGGAAHWKYKGGASGGSGYEAKMSWLRQLIDWQDELVDTKQLAEEFKAQVFDERVYVFTPAGKLIDLPRGSTALDFAYRVHTDVGHRCRGAKANGKIIGLTQQLETGQRLEILTAKNGGPSRDWLSEQRGYLKSTRARNKVQQWFKHQDKDKNIAAGKTLLEKELRKNALELNHFSGLAEHFNYNSNEELYAGIGAGDKGIHQVMNAVRQLLGSEETEVTRETVLKRKPKVTKRSRSSDILVEGVGNLLTRMAGCCKPIPGDDIAGFVTLGRGIMIHRRDCRYLLSSQEKSPEKVLEVSWTHEVNKHYLIDLVIRAYDRKGLLSDITALMSTEKVSVTSLNTKVNHKQLEVRIDVQVEMANLTNVSRLINLLEQLPNIIGVHRISS